MAAIMSAVAGSIAVSVYVVSLDDHDRRTYPRVAKDGQAYVSLDHSGDVRRLGRIRAAVASNLPVTQTTAVRVLAARSGGVDWAVPAANRCPAELGIEVAPGEPVGETTRAAPASTSPRPTRAPTSSAMPASCAG